MSTLDPIAYLNKSNIRRTLIFHFVLWVLAFVILIFVFTNGKTPVKIDYYYTIVFLIVVALAVEFNFYVLIKYLLKKEKYLLYLIAFVHLGLGFGELLLLFLNFFLDSKISHIFLKIKCFSWSRKYIKICIRQKNDFYIILYIKKILSQIFYFFPREGNNKQYWE